MNATTFSWLKGDNMVLQIQCENIKLKTTKGLGRGGGGGKQPCLQISSTFQWASLTQFLKGRLVFYSSVPFRAPSLASRFYESTYQNTCVPCLKAFHTFSSCCVWRHLALPFFNHLWHCLPPVPGCYQK